ncbi:MAG: NAD(P)/FAD-dependent oxidoreductase [Desulfobacterales bacterium]|nr:NAD(P)/FAD-dependent oxidoreductase [Desulfobacterales bacterium]
MNKIPVIVIGAGPAGLAAAHELVGRGVKPLVLEAGPDVGGIARTIDYKRCLFDIGGHRFFTRLDSIDRLWHEMLGPDFISVKRSSSIFYNARTFAYPLRPANALRNLGAVESFRISLSYLKSQLFPYPEEDTFEQWMANRFGQRLYRMFFKTYTEKVWGLPCSAIQSEWASQRIKGLSMVSIVANALFGKRSAKTLIDCFHYPKRGPGMMWDRFSAAVMRAGGDIQTGAEVTGLRHTAGYITALRIRRGEVAADIPVRQVISSMPITSLIGALDPAPPENIQAAAAGLSYRSLVMAGLILNREKLFPDQWIYVHDPDVGVGRIQNFKNWSPDMAPAGRRTNIGMEYFCNENDRTWNMPDTAIVEMASRELENLGLARSHDVVDGMVIRQAKAYPVYDHGYQRNLDIIRGYLDGFDNLQTIGRSGTHRYNNMDHSMQSGILAARNVLGERHDLWSVSDETEYLEAPSECDAAGQAPGTLVAQVFTRMDKGAFGAAVGTVTGLAICLATLWLVVKGGVEVGPKMGLLAQYFWGYTVTFNGAAVGLLYGFIAGFITGWLFAFLRNVLLMLYLFRIRKTAEVNSVKDLLDRM